MTLEQIAAWKGQVGQGTDFGSVFLLRALLSKVVKERGPGILSRSDEDRVRMQLSLLWQGSDVESSKTDIGTLCPVVVGNLICTIGGCNINLNNHQIRLIVQVQR